MQEPLFLHSFRRAEDAALLIVRTAIGAFLIYGVWDNIVDAARMQEFVEFLRKFGFPSPAKLARLSVWAQFAVGVAFVLGLCVRWAGIVCAIHFAIAIWMVDRFAGIRGAFPAACLLLIGLYLVARGGGRYALDRWLARRTAP